MNIINGLKNNYEINIHNNTIHIILYKKIVDISYNSITIEFNDFSIVIKGEKLLINKLNKDELSIQGIIKGIIFN